MIHISRRKEIILDFDGTIANSIKAICDTYNEDFQYYKDFTHTEWCDINTWDFKELILASKEYLNQLWEQPRFFERLTFMDNAESALTVLKEKYDISIASLGTQPNEIGKEIWIHKHMPYIKNFYFIDVEKYPDKSHIDMNSAIFIDDVSKYLRNTNANKKILFGDSYPWNDDWRGMRCYNWVEVLKELY